MNDVLESPWRGRMRLLTTDRHLPHRNEPLSEPEREALEAWLSNGTHIITHTRGRLSRDGRPVWVVTTRGVLVATLTDEGFDRVRARAHWVPAEHLRRVDMVTDDALPLVRIVTISRRFVLHGVDQDSAVRFVALAKAAMAASEPPRRSMPRAAGMR
jgi:hypothetical protein